MDLELKLWSDPCVVSETIDETVANKSSSTNGFPTDQPLNAFLLPLDQSSPRPGPTKSDRHGFRIDVAEVYSNYR